MYFRMRAKAARARVTQHVKRDLVTEDTGAFVPADTMGILVNSVRKFTQKERNIW